MRLEVIRTGDGSPSIRVVELDECYHSRRGAWNESVHVYIRNGFEAWMRQHPHAERIRIFEMGFGTGLNALLTAAAAGNYERLTVEYSAVELHPVPEEVWRQLEFPEVSDSGLLERLHTAAFGVRQEVSDRFMLKKLLVDVMDFEPEESFDLIYFDAFGPRAQPELWTDRFLQRVAGWLITGGRLVTYCTKGHVKRGFRAGKFHVAALPGPPGKREMLCVISPGNGL